MKQKAGSLKTTTTTTKKPKIDRPLSNLTKTRREKTQIRKIRNKKREITINTMEIQGILRDYFENRNSNKLETQRNGQISRYL
jgi:hypothetical protein